MTQEWSNDNHAPSDIKSTTREYEGVAFEVDIGDDLLLPDLPSLEDHDANKEDDDEIICDNVNESDSELDEDDL